MNKKRLLILSIALGASNLQALTLTTGDSIKALSKTTQTVSQSIPVASGVELSVSNGLDNTKLKAAVGRLSKKRSQLRIGLPYAPNNKKLPIKKRQTNANVALMAQTVSTNPHLRHLKIDGLLQSQLPNFGQNFSHNDVTALTFSFDNSFSAKNIYSQKSQELIKNTLLESYIKKLPRLRTIRLAGFLDASTQANFSALNLNGEEISISVDGSSTRQTDLKRKANKALKKGFANKASQPLTASAR